MKRLLTILLTFSVVSTSIGQQGISYKAIIKDNAGIEIANDLIIVQFNILEGVAETNLYTETHSPTTDANGMVIVNIGEGTQVSGDYATIDWRGDTHALNVQINTGGGLVDMGTTTFQRVPYALQADEAANVFSGDYNDPADRLYVIGNGTQFFKQNAFTIYKSSNALLGNIQPGPSEIRLDIDGRSRVRSGTSPTAGIWYSDGNTTNQFAGARNNNSTGSTVILERD